MTKKQTLGKKGEELIKGLLKKHNIHFIDLAKTRIPQEVSVNFIDDSGVRVKYNYIRQINSHPFDIVINNKNVEIKTSSIDRKGKFCCGFTKNKISLIDFIILIIAPQKRITEDVVYIILEKSFFSKYKGLNFYLTDNRFNKLKEKTFIKKLKELVK